MGKNGVVEKSDGHYSVWVFGRVEMKDQNKSSDREIKDQVLENEKMSMM